MRAAESRLDPGTVDDIDLLDPHVHATRDLTEVWRWLRQHEPVRWHRSTASTTGQGLLGPHRTVGHRGTVVTGK